MKLNKKGFTLIELVATILLLSIIITLSTIAVINVMQNSKERENQASMTLIETATRDYINKYAENYHIKNGVIYCVDIESLINENLLISNISYDGDNIKDKTVKVEYDNNNYSYTLEDKEVCSLQETK